MTVYGQEDRPGRDHWGYDLPTTYTPSIPPEAYYNADYNSYNSDYNSYNSDDNSYNSDDNSYNSDDNSYNSDYNSYSTGGGGSILGILFFFLFLGVPAVLFLFYGMVSSESNNTIPASSSIHRIRNLSTYFPQKPQLTLVPPPSQSSNSIKTQIVGTPRKVQAGDGVANLRVAASTDVRIIEKVPNGTSVSVVDQYTNSSGQLWYKVKVGNQIGWIYSELLI